MAKGKINQHGVAVIPTHSGSVFGCKQYDVPICCLTCRHYDYGETGDYGEVLSGPSCGRYVMFPTRKGQCAWHTAPELQFKTHEAFEAHWDREDEVA